MARQFTITSPSFLRFLISIAAIVLAPIGYWNVGVAELQSGFLGLLFLYLFGVVMEYNDVPLSTANIFPVWVNHLTWVIGIALFFFY